jgi:hypothetical protein
MSGVRSDDVGVHEAGRATCPAYAALLIPAPAISTAAHARMTVSILSPTSGPHIHPYLYALRQAQTVIHDPNERILNYSQCAAGTHISYTRL